MWLYARPPFVAVCILFALSLPIGAPTRTTRSVEAPPRPAPSAPTPIAAPRPAPVVARCERADISAFRGDVRTLAELWLQRHPCEPLPLCDRRDRIVTLRADLDPEPGRERVVANARFGIAMYDARGALLATADLRCDGWRDVEDLFATDGPRLRLSRFPTGQLEVTSRSYAHCGESVVHSVFGRRGTQLAELVALEGSADHGCGVGEWRNRVEITVLRPNVIEWRATERSRRLRENSDRYGPWTTSHEQVTWTAGRDGVYAK